MAQGYGNTLGASPAIDASDLARISESIQGLLNHLSNNNDRAASIVSRVYGEGDPAGKDTPRPTSVGIMGNINSLLDDLNNACGRNTSLIDRLSRLG